MAPRSPWLRSTRAVASGVTALASLLSASSPSLCRDVETSACRRLSRNKRGFRSGFLARLQLAILAAASLVWGLLVAAPAHANGPGLAQQVAVAAYINPTGDPATWNQLIGSTPGRVGIVVANVLNGPDSHPNAAWTSVIRLAHAAGMKVLGYTDTGYFGTTGMTTRLGSTSPNDWMSQAESDVNAWYSFYGSNLDGIFFDDGQNDCGPGGSWASWYEQLNGFVKYNHPGATTVANPGTVVPQCYENAADVLLTFEGSYDTYVNSYVPLSWNPANPRKLWHLVYAAPDQAAMENAISLSKSRGAGYVEVGNDVLANPYDTLPPAAYWQDELNHVPPSGVGTTPPSVPHNLASTTIGGTSFTFHWDASAAGSAPVASYEIYRNGQWDRSVRGDTTSYTAFGLLPNAGYSFTVAARDEAGNVSALSSVLNINTNAPDARPPSAPGGLSATATDYTSTSLHWNASTDSDDALVGYDVYQGGRLTYSVPPSMTSMVIGGLRSGVTSSAFTVKARDASGNTSGSSNSVAPKTLSLPGNPPAMISSPAVQHIGSTVYSANYLVPFAFRRVFITTSVVPNPVPSGFGCWWAASAPWTCADYMIENTTLYHFVGHGSDWTWVSVRYAPPNVNGYNYSWLINPSDIGNPTSDDGVFDGQGYGPISYCGLHVACVSEAVAPATVQGPGNPSAPRTFACQTTTAYPINCGTGDFWHSFDDISVPGRGPALSVQRTYNSLSAGTDSIFGYGWSSSYDMSLSTDSSGNASIRQEGGATAGFYSPDGTNYSPAPGVLATLTKNQDGTFTFVRNKRERIAFSSTGKLTSLSDLNGATTTLAYDGQGRLSTVTDAAGRALTFSYGANSKVSQVADPAGRHANYSYDGSGNLTSVVDVGGGTTSFTYDSGHLMLTMTDPRGGVVTNVFDDQGRATSQTDPMGRITTLTYTEDGTTIVHPGGDVEVQNYFDGELYSSTKAFGTPQASTWSYSYDPASFATTSVTDPNGHVTTMAYDSDGNLTSTTDPLGRVTTAVYNSVAEPISVTDPSGVVTTMTYDSSGNPLTTSRPLVGSSQVSQTSYTHGDSTHPGDITSVTDPRGQTTTLAYDASGNLIRATDAAGNATTFTYDSIGRQLTSVAPKGNVQGGNPAAFTTSFVTNAFGDVTSITDALGHVTTSTYDANRNRTGTTDAANKTTTTAYNADNEATTVTRADNTTLTYAYDASGNQTTQTDGSSW